MSTFEVSVTPTRVKQMRRLDEAREPTDVFMGPFTPKATVSFLDIPVGKTARRFLTIHNKYEDEVKILVTKIPKTELGISLEWTSNVLTANNNASLELIWNPVKVGIFKDVVQVTDSKGNKKDVYLTMKSIELKKPGAKKAWQAPVLAKRLKASPQRTIVKKQAVLQQKSSILKNNTQENCLVTPGINKTRPLGDSNLNATNIFNADGMNFSNIDNLFVPNKTNKENKSPVTPQNGTGPFKEVNRTETIPKESSCLEYLASLPTPKGGDPYMERKRPICPDHVRFTIPEMSVSKITTPNFGNASDMSVMAQMPTPSGKYNETSLRPNATPVRTNTTTFEPHLVSTLTKFSKKNEDDSNITGKELFFDALEEMSFNTPKPLGSMERLSTETYIKVERLSTETYVKGSISPMSSHEDENLMSQRNVGPIMDKTRVITPPLPLSMIKEELEVSEVDTTNREQLQSKTFNMKDQVQTTPDAHKKAVEELVMTPLSRARMISQSTTELNKQDLDLMNLKANQGSMPNLFDERSNEQLRNIENNRYFFQKPQNDVRDESMISTTSNLDTMFRESEIRAQSSQFNLNEIGKSHENIPVFNKTVTKHVGMAPAMSCLDFTRSRESINSSGSSTSSYKMKGHKPYVSTSSPQLNRGGPTSVMTISPPKRSHEPTTAPIRSTDGFVVPNVTNRTKTWGAKQPKKINLYKYPMKLTLQTSLKPKEEERVILYNPDLHISAFINPDPFSPTTTTDPFLASTMYLDEQSTDRHEQKFKKWLNALVTIPADLDSNKGKIDVGKLFNEVQNKKQVVPDTKEKVVSKYYKTRLDYLRATAINLYQSREVSEVLTKLMPQIEKSAIVIREDKDLHLQIGLQQQVLDLLFAFNTLWLRLGLEVVFGEIIPMSSNTDVHTLARYIIDRMFKDQYLEKKYTKVQLLSATYKEQVKKHTLKKFFCLLMFLDTAKNKKIIKQNPCLFTKTSPYKETREILLRFSSMMLSSVGDVTKYLKRYGYVLTHKQTYLDEFDYAFTNLAVDLRDGVRLTRVMEIISLREDLSSQLRVPAVSRLQKVHNVDVALKALAAADYQIKGDITAKDIADGHREKTLSLLWQIIHKFRAPKFNAAAKTIQQWWRRSWLRIAISRRIQEKRQKRMELAAKTIQRHFRGWNVRKWFIPYKAKVLRACVMIQKNVRRCQAMKKYKLMKMRQSQEYCATKIQSYFRMKYARREYLMKKHATIVIQKYVKGYLLMKRERKEYLILKQSTKIIQNRFRAHMVMKETRKTYLYQRQLIINVQQKYRATLSMREQRQKYVQMKMAALVLQSRYRATKAMQSQRLSYQTLKSATITIQQRFRATLLMHEQRQVFLRLRSATIIIQQRYLAYVQMKRDRTNYILLQLATSSIQSRYRAQLAMRRERQKFLTLKSATRVIQTRLRATLDMKRTRHEFITMRNATEVVQKRYRALVKGRESRKRYLELRAATIAMQRRFRANQLMKNEAASYQKIKLSCIFIQKFYRGFKLTQNTRANFLQMRQATIILQKKWRATLEMRKYRVKFLAMQFHTVIIQQRFRGLLQMRRERKEFLKLKSATIVIQRQYRALVAMRVVKKQFLTEKNAAIVLQRRYRAKTLMEGQRKEFSTLKQSTICVQTRFRALLKMKRQRANYLKQKNAAKIIQVRFRAQVQMKQQQKRYQKIRNAAKTIQIQFRAQQLMKQNRQEFLELKSSVISMQNRVRATQKMKRQRTEFTKMRNAAVTIQTHLRATLAMKRTRTGFLKIKNAALIIQRQFRALLAMRSERAKYLNQRNAIINVQNRFRANLLMKMQRNKYLELKSAAITFQTRFRAVVLMRQERLKFLQLKSAATIIQTRYRARKIGTQKQQEFIKIRHSVVIIQHRFRTLLQMRRQRSQYLMLRTASTTLQTRYRALIQMREERRTFVVLKRAVIVVQSIYRANVLMKKERTAFLTLKNAVMVVQGRYRAQLAMKLVKNEYEKVRTATLCIQRRWRGVLLMRRERIRYLEMRQGAMVIQERFRAIRVMRQERNRYNELKRATIFVQRKYRAKKLMIEQRVAYLTLLKATITIQLQYKSLIQMRETRAKYIQLRSATCLIQQRFRDYLVMKVVRQEFLKKRSAAVRIQQKFRAIKAAKHQREYYLNLKEFFVRFQARVRGFLDRKAYNARLTPEVLEARRRIKAAKKIQALWRGFNCRKKYQTTRMNRIANRINATKKTMSRTISVKRQVILDINVLKGTYRVYEAISILKRLERLSRIIPQVLIPHSNFIATFCYSLMALTIRSEPDKQVIELCACIILNLSKYPPTKEVSFSEYGLTTIAQMLLRWCDKECSIFITLCTLIWIFGHDPEMNEKIRKFMVTPDAIYMLRETKKLTLRKEKMRQTVKKQFGSNLNEGVKSHQHNPLPNLEPDYGLVKGKPYVFMSPSFALETVFSKFNIQL